MTVPGNLSSPLLATAAEAAVEAVATKSLRFNNGDSPYLNRTPSSAGNRRTFTFSCWVKRSVLGSSLMRRFFAAGASSVSTGNVTLAFYQDTLFFQISSSSYRITSSQVFRDVSAWYHIVLAVDTTQATDSNRVKIYVNGSQVTDFGTVGYPSQNTDTSVNNTEQHIVGAGINSGGGVPDGAFDGLMADVYMIDGSQLGPTSFGAFDDNGVWQAAIYSGTYGTNGFHLLDFANESTVGNDSSGNNNDFTANNLTGEVSTIYSTSATITHDGAADTTYTTGVVSAMFDGSTSTNFGVVNGTSNKFVNIAFATGITVSSSLKVHAAFRNGMVWKVNGNTVTSSGVSHPNTGLQTLNFTGTMNSLRCEVANGNALEIHLIQVDGSALIDGDPADLDVLFDVPTNGTQSDTGAGGEVSGNYCVFNVLNKGNDVTLSNGNLQAACTSSSKDGVFGTIGVSSGKWYWEVELTSSDSNTNAAIGIATSVLSPDAGSPTSAGAYFYSSYNGNKWLNSADSSYGASYGTGDVIGVALDLDNDTLTFYKNGSTQGDATTSLPSGTYFPYVGDNANNSAQTVVANWGQRSFSHSAPSGYKALCTTNFPTPTVANGRDHFYALASTGTFGGGTVTDSDANFTPDWVWVKRRNAAERHKLYDILRGTDGTRYKHLESDGSDAEGSGESGITAFVAGGYTSEGGGHINSDGQPFISWMWNAGTSTASNTDGTGTSSVQVRANTTAGFSIVTYTGGSSSPANSDSGDSFGHGLGAAPDLVICKKRSGANSWPVYHRAAPTGALILDNTNANDSSSFLFAKKDPTSTEVFLGNNPEINNSSHNYVAYCFAPVDGFSFFGEFSGNGSSDGPFLHTNHRPAWIMIKCHDTNTSSTNWIIWDTARDPINLAEIPLRADLPNTEIAASDNYDIDILSNGFKIRTSNGGINHASRSYVFASFAENPFQANGGLAR